MNKWLVYLLCLPLLSFGQVSFIKEYPTTQYYTQVAKAELGNGNYVCSILIQDNQYLYNRLLLLDRCGELLTDLVISHGNDYMFLNNFIDLDSNTILATGFLSDSLFKMVYLELDNKTLEVKKQVQHIETSLYYLRTFFENGNLTQVGTDKGYRILSSRLNKNYQRNLHLYRVFDAESFPDLSAFAYFGYSNYSLYSRETYSNPDISNYPWNKIRCMDKKLRDRYVIADNTDSTYTTFNSRIIFLGGDTLLLVANVRKNGTITHFVRQYWRDSIIYERPLDAQEDFSAYSSCYYKEGKMKCFNADSEIAEFNAHGELIFFDDHFKNVLIHGDIASPIATKDGGFLGARYAWNETQGHLIRFVKITRDYQILDHPAPGCEVGIEKVSDNREVIIYPNPAKGMIHIQCEDEVLRYQIFTLQAQLVHEGRGHQREFDIELDLYPGSYVIRVQTTKGWQVQKFLILN
jgi:hypothetical protein